MRQTFRYIMLTLSFALVTYGLLAWQQVNFSLATLGHLNVTDLHPVLMLIFGLGLITPTRAELIRADRLEEPKDSHEES